MRFFLISILFYTSSAFAEKELFLSGVNSELSKENVYEEIERAFIGRKWRVVQNDESGVTGRIFHRGVDASVRIFLEDYNLYYTCKGTRVTTAGLAAGGSGGSKTNKNRSAAGGSGGSKTSKKKKEFCPKKWIANIKSDSAWILQGL